MIIILSSLLSPAVAVEALVVAGHVDVDHVPLAQQRRGGGYPVADDLVDARAHAARVVLLLLLLLLLLLYHYLIIILL